MKINYVIILSVYFAKLFAQEDALLEAEFVVVNEEGDAIPDVTVSIHHYYWPMVGGEKKKSIKDVTSKSGKYILKVKTTDLFSLTLIKKGYYTTSWDIELKSPHSSNRWFEDKLHKKVVMKKIHNPRPPFVNHVQWETLPAKQNVGYDLLIGDWVKPHGKGNVSDIVFNLEKGIEPSTNAYWWIVGVEFPGKGNGIIPVEKDDSEWKDDHFLVSGKMAPEAGYQKQLVLVYGEGTFADNKFEKLQGDFTKGGSEREYWIKIRTENKDDKNLSMYGKIGKGLFFVVRGVETAEVNFSYYVSPDPNNRSLEWDKENSLVPNAKITTKLKRKH
jgi:hypothetical protein